jgi:hypothetical protein
VRQIKDSHEAIQEFFSKKSQLEHIPAGFDFFSSSGS